MSDTPNARSLDSAVGTASNHLHDILAQAVEYAEPAAAVVVWDAQSELSVALTDAYRRCLPEATFIEFDRAPQATILGAFEFLEAGDLVVLIQSTSFRLAKFRIRVELFRRSIKVIEHPHLARMPGPEGLIYIDSLAYDGDYLRGVGTALKERLDRAQRCVIHSGGEQLVFSSGFETARLNVGDYREMKNVGGQFPIGEVFTESADLEAVNGCVRIALFGDTSYSVNRPEGSITLVVEQGRVTDTIDSTAEFDAVLASIREDEGQVWLRELGLGLNRAFTLDRVVSDVGSYERMCGLHLSLGAKHMIYNKPNIRKKDARQHVDVFVDTESFTIEDEVVFRDGAWLIEAP